MPSTEKPANVLGVIAFVETDVLVATRGWLRTFDGNAVERCFKKFDVVRIGTTDFNTQRHATTVGKHRPLGSQLASIGRVFPSFFPHPAATSSSPRPRFASSTRCLEVRHTPRAMLSTVGKKRPVWSTLGSNDAKCFRNRTRGARLSTGIPCAVRRKCLPRLSLNQLAVALLRDSSDSEEEIVSAAATIQ